MSPQTSSLHLSDEQLHKLTDAEVWAESDRADTAYAATESESDFTYSVRVTKETDRRGLFSDPAKQDVRPAKKSDPKPKRERPAEIARDEPEPKATRAGGRFWLPDEVFEMRLTPEHIALYGFVCRKAGRSGKAWPARKTMAAACRLRPQTVTRVLHDLVQGARMLTQQRRRNLSAILTVTDPSVWNRRWSAGRARQRPHLVKLNQERASHGRSKVHAARLGQSIGGHQERPSRAIRNVHAKTA